MTKNFVSKSKPSYLESKFEKMLEALLEGAMVKKCKDRVCETRPFKQTHFNENSTETWLCNQLIHLAQWLNDECHNPRANSKNIIRVFCNELNQMRGEWR